MNGVIPVSYTHLDVYKRQQTFRDVVSLLQWVYTDCGLQNNRYGKMVCVVGVDGGAPSLKVY